MKKIIALVAFLTITLSALAVDMGQVAYIGGTVPALKEGTVSRLDTALETALEFEYSGGKVSIPLPRLIRSNTRKNVHDTSEFCPRSL